MNMGRNSGLALAAAFAFGLSACSDEDPDPIVNADAGMNNQPDAGNNNTCTGTYDETTGAACPGYIAASFRIDDSANKTYTAADYLAWKGSFDFDTETRELSYEGWTPPFPLLYDDGSIVAGGHEPAGATAGDSIWSVVTYVKVPAAGEPPVAFEYGAIRNSNANGDDGQWIWAGTNGTFTVAPGDTGAVNPTGLTIPAFGDRDLRLTIDINVVKTATIGVGVPFMDVDPALGVAVKSSAWGWFPVLLMDDGLRGDAAANDGIFTMVLSEYEGEGQFKHVGLLNQGATPEFVFMFGPFMPNGEGPEYKGGDGNVARSEGVTAATRTGDTGAFTDVTVGYIGGNTSVTVP
jgi:hypothetical protein